MTPETTPNETEFCMECRNELEPRSIKQGWPKKILKDNHKNPRVGSPKPMFYAINWGYTTQSGYSKGDYLTNQK